MTREEVYTLMASSTHEAEWNENVDKVKAAHDGELPDFWYTDVARLPEQLFGTEVT